jgi:hypothetical protein
MVTRNNTYPCLHLLKAVRSPCGSALGPFHFLGVLLTVLVTFSLISCVSTPQKSEKPNPQEPLIRYSLQFQYKEKGQVRFAGDALWWKQGAWGRWDIYGAFRVLAGQIYYNDQSIILLNHLEKYYVELNTQDTWRWRGEIFSPSELLTLLSRNQATGWTCASHSNGKECRKGDIRVSWVNQNQMYISSSGYSLELTQRQEQSLFWAEHPDWYKVQIPRHYPRKQP